MSENNLDKLVRQSYYKPDYAKSYYQKNKELIIQRSKERWARLTEEERQAYYEERKTKRRLKKCQKD